MNREAENLQQLAKLIRYYILKSTTIAGSGHATSSLSAVELTTVLFSKYFHYDLKNPQNLANDRFILSKGHGSPLLYSLFTAFGAITEKELLTLRKFTSRLEGHPVPRFPYADVASGSLGQGLSVGVGMALALNKVYQVSSVKCQELGSIKNQASRLQLPEQSSGGQASIKKIDNMTHDTLTHDAAQKPRVFVLLGDGELAEGQNWEAIEMAAYYKLNNLIAILDVNRLGQSQETILGHDVQTYANRVASFGWRTYVVENGHDLELIDKAYQMIIKQSQTSSKPAMLIAKTIKGKGVSFLEDKDGWHGIPLSEEQLEQALKELGKIDNKISGKIQEPVYVIPAKAGILRSPIRSGMTKNENPKYKISRLNGIHDAVFAHSSQTASGPDTKYQIGEQMATRKAYGNALVRLGKIYPDIVVLDGDVQNSTYTSLFAKQFPDRFFEMFIAEQNLVSAAVGLAKLGFKPHIATFGAFLTRAFDQIRMAALSQANLVICGSHAGVSIGQDGPSQMGLEDLAMFRSVQGSTVLYPADGVATEKLLEQANFTEGIVYIRTARPATPVLYNNDEQFEIGGSKIFVSSVKRHVSSDKKKNMTRDTLTHDTITIITAGITVIEALKAQQELAKENIGVTILDCYCLKPIDKTSLQSLAKNAKAIITVEDHYPQGGLGDAVLEALATVEHPPVYKLAVGKVPRSGKPEELLDYEGINSKAIIDQVRKIKDN